MNYHEDEQFERYLRQFQPLSPEPLPAREARRVGQRRLVFAAWAGAAAITLVAVALYLGSKPSRSAQPTAENGAVPRIANSQPLTIRAANELLLHSSSTKAALDDVAFQAQVSEIPKGKQSALVALSKENK